MTELVPLEQDPPLYELGLAVQGGQTPLIDLGQFGIHLATPNGACCHCGSTKNEPGDFYTEAWGMYACCTKCYKAGKYLEEIFNAQTVFPGQPHQTRAGTVFNCALLIDGVLYRTHTYDGQYHSILDFVSGVTLRKDALHIRNHTLANLFAARMFNNGAGFR